MTAEELVRRADEKLYEAKAEGRNRVVQLGEAPTSFRAAAQKRPATTLPRSGANRRVADEHAAHAPTRRKDLTKRRHADEI